MDLGELLERSGAIMRGHFVLTSGRHSDVYVEKFRLLEAPAVLSPVCSQIAVAARGFGPIELVAGPTTGGVIVAYEIARQLGVSAAYVESEHGAKRLRRDRRLSRGVRTLIVDDVLTTGRSLLETRQAIERAGGVAVGYAVLIDRSEGALQLGAPFFAAHRVEARSFAAHEVPPSLAALPAVKPGTRAAS